MKNRIKRKIKEISRERLKKMINDRTQIDAFKKILSDGLSESEIKLLMDVFRESRMDDLFEQLGIDNEKLDKAKRKIIKLHPKSNEWPLLSTLYRDHKGKYQVETLFNEYHDSTLKEGLMIGMTYGKKFLAEDIQSSRFSKQDILHMSKKELFEYCNESKERV